MKAHPGEISFPGGMYEERDGDTMRTALRESCEEIGVSVRDVEIIGRLDDERTLSGFVITPYVGVIPYPYNFSISRREVAYLVHLPYEHIARGQAARELTDYKGRVETIDAIYYNGERIWGATCRILLKLKRIVDHEHG
jgi:8-oxo-dGTP pyrophosphatase MutT (NUDIX family)